MIFQVETFKKLHGEDQMAVDKLKEGIDGFAKDQVKLEQMVHEIVETSEHWLRPHFIFVDANTYLCCFHTGRVFFFSVHMALCMIVRHAGIQLSLSPLCRQEVDPGTQQAVFGA